KDCTCFYAKVIDENLELAVDLLSDLALHPRFDEAELQKERGVVLEEIAMVEDTPEDLVNDVLCEAQYSGSLRRPILGTGDLIRAYSREDLLRYWQRHYVPQNTVLAIAGHYDWDAFVKLAEQYFNAFPNDHAPEAVGESQIFVPGRKARDKDTEQLNICMGFPGVALGADDLYPLNVFNNAIGGGMSSRLFQRIREELGMVYTVYTFPSCYPGCGSFNVFAGTSPANGETVILELQSEFVRALKEGLSEKEFLSAKAQLRSGYVMGLESSSARMQSLGRGMLLLGRVNTPDETLAKIEAVTPEDVRRIAEQTIGQPSSAGIVGRGAQQYLEAMQ
ncbi:MAG: pitrilysin family protein, partial [Eubacteriales bacterium]|nr:pitrilysin family protein [Eubacteriales bacterium]